MQEFHQECHCKMIQKFHRKFFRGLFLEKFYKVLLDIFLEVPSRLSQRVASEFLLWIFSGISLRFFHPLSKTSQGVTSRNFLRNIFQKLIRGTPGEIPQNFQEDLVGFLKNVLDEFPKEFLKSFRKSALKFYRRNIWRNSRGIPKENIEVFSKIILGKKMKEILKQFVKELPEKLLINHRTSSSWSL